MTTTVTRTRRPWDSRPKHRQIESFRVGTVIAIRMAKVHTRKCKKKATMARQLIKWRVSKPLTSKRDRLTRAKR